MRIAYRNSRTIINNVFFQHQSLIYKHKVIADHGDVGTFKNRLAHIDTGFCHFTIFTQKYIDGFDTGERFQRKSCFIRQTFIINILGDTSAPITAHLGFRSISVKNTHFKIRNVRFTDHDQAITANTKTSVADIFGNSTRIRQFLFHTVDVNIIVTSTVHLCKFHFHGNILLNKFIACFIL